MESIQSKISTLIQRIESSNRFLLPLIAIGGGCVMVLPLFLCMATIFVVMAAGPMSGVVSPTQVNHTVDQEVEVVGTKEERDSSSKGEIFSLSCGEHKEGTLTYGVTDQWRFEGSRQDLVSVRLMNSDENVKTKLQLIPLSGKDSAYEQFTIGSTDHDVIVENYVIQIDDVYIMSISSLSEQAEYDIELLCRSLATPTFTPKATSSPIASATPEPTAIPGLGMGDIQITLIWWSTADLDLHVVDPFGEEISFENANAGSGGRLDYEGNGSCALASTTPVENVFWATDTAPLGEYTVAVYYFGTCREAGEQEFEVIVRVDGQVVEIVSGSINPFEGFQVYQFSYE